MYVADQRAITDPVHPLLLVRVGSNEDQPFRCRADLLYEVDANLSLANLDWDDFRDQIDASGVYGGVEVATGAQPADPTDPALLAYRSTTDEPITISVPAVPLNLWFEVREDLRDASMSGYGVGYMQVMALAKQILERTEGVTKQRPEDDAVITLPANEWAFIGERAKLLQAIYAHRHGDPRQRGLAARQITDLVSRHLR